MNRRTQTAFAAALLALSTVPAASAEEVSPVVAMSRLRACVINGSAGAPRDSLQAAVTAVRALCRPQIDRVRRLSDETVAAENAGLSDDELAERRKLAWGRIDFDLATLVARETGLQP